MAAKRGNAPLRPELMLGFQLGLGVLMVFAGAVALLSSVGVLPSDGFAGPVGRVITFFVAIAVVLLGLMMVGAPFYDVARHHGASDPLSAAWLGARQLHRRITPQSVGATVLLIPVTYAYWRALAGAPAPLWSNETLIGLVAIEFLLIHGFPFLVFAALFAGLHQRSRRPLPYIPLVLLAALYAAFAWQFGGLRGVSELAYLAAPNIVAMAGLRDRSGPALTAGMRWVLKFTTLFGVAIVLDHTSLRGEGNIEVGAFYFGIQLACELFRVAEIPLDLAPAWSALPPHKRRMPGVWTEGS